MIEDEGTGLILYHKQVYTPLSEDKGSLVYRASRDEEILKPIDEENVLRVFRFLRDFNNQGIESYLRLGFVNHEGFYVPQSDVKMNVLGVCDSGEDIMRVNTNIMQELHRNAYVLNGDGKGFKLKGYHYAGESGMFCLVPFGNILNRMRNVVKKPRDVDVYLHSRRIFGSAEELEDFGLSRVETKTLQTA